MSNQTKSIYIIQHVESLKVYVGQSVNPKRRWTQHQAKSKYNTTQPLYADIREFGRDSFSLTVIEEGLTFDEAGEAEDYWIEFLQSRKSEFGYNLAQGGLIGRGWKHPNPPDNRGRKASAETRAKQSAIHSARKRKPHSAETRAKLSRPRKKWTTEQKAKLSSRIPWNKKDSTSV